MDRPLTIGNVHNISLESSSDESDEYPHLVAQFPCETERHECLYLLLTRTLKVCCAALWFHDVHNATVKGISMTLPVEIETISLVVLKNASGVTVQVNATCFSTHSSSVGIAIYEATSVEVHASSVSNCNFGLVFQNTTNTHITKVTAMYNRVGIYLHIATDTHISNTIAVNNTGNGIDLSTMNNTYIANMAISHNGYNGLNSFNMSNTHITNTTTAYNNDGGMFLSTMSNTRVTNTTATHNSLAGIYFAYMNNTHITKTTVTYNGKDDNPTSQICCGQIVIISSTYTLIYHTSFTNVSAPSTATSLPAVIVLYKSTLYVSDCDFTRNNVSAVRAYASNITVSGDVTFSSNRAYAGTAFILIHDSILTSAKNSHIYFLDNCATNTGGVFKIINNNIYQSQILYSPISSTYYSTSTCFFNTEGSRSQTRFTFANNSAGKGGDILYGGQVAFGFDGDWNCLDSFKHISNIFQDGLSLISSDPLRVCLCNETGQQPDCLVLADPTLHTAYPGQTINISAVVVGQDFGTVAGSVYAQFLHKGSTPQLESGQEVQSVIQHKCNHLYYTIFSQSAVFDAVLVLTADDVYVSEFINIPIPDQFFEWVFYYKTFEVYPLLLGNNAVYVNISLLPCPPGFMLTTNSPFKCDCNSILQQMHGIKCHIQEQTIGRSGLLWVGMIQDGNGTVAASEYCPLDYCSGEDSNVTLSEPDSQCNYNHSGTLCGGCQPGLSLALGSAQCLQCSDNYLALLIPLTLAGPVLVFSIKILDLTISQGTLNGLIFYANVVKANEFIFLPRGQTNPLTVFIAWLNLDLGVETCLFQGLNAYSKTWLQFVFPFYIWSIAGLIIILARYSDRVAKVMGNNSVPVLATLFLLSYAKLLRTIITALSYTMVYTSHGPKAVWTADGNVDYLSPQHAPLFATAVAMLLFLWLPYTLILFLGQWLHMCNCRLIVRMLMRIKPFLDAHYGPLKSKHRYWFGALLFVRAAILLISALIPSNRSSVVVLCTSIISVVLTYFGQLVYHNLAVSIFDTFSFMNLAVVSVATCFITTANGRLSVSAYTLIGVAFVQFVGLVLFKIFSILKQSEMVRRCLPKNQPVEDDWELYEEAAIQREMEADEEEQDSEDSGSVESLPTY